MIFGYFYPRRLAKKIVEITFERRWSRIDIQDQKDEIKQKNAESKEETNKADDSAKDVSYKVEPKDAE